MLTVRDILTVTDILKDILTVSYILAVDIPVIV